VNDTLTTNEDTAGTINVLSNDTDIDGPSLTASLVAGFGPAHGTLSFTTPGTFTYTPAANYNGPDSFKYSASDGSLSSTATVTINVLPINDAPIAVDDSINLPYNASQLTIPVLPNDSDIDSSSLTINSLSATTNGGTVGSSDDKVVTYTPPAGGLDGVDTFTYTITDGASTSNAATVTVRACSGPSVGDTAGLVTGTFTRLDDLSTCKFNSVTLEVDPTTSTILFEPGGTSATKVNYRGIISFGPRPLVTDATTHAIELLLKYDKDGDGATYGPTAVPWCDNPSFVIVDGEKLVDATTTTIPAGDTWCIASEETFGQGTDSVLTTWQVFGFDDPRFS
jgi:hypothetical protein